MRLRQFILASVVAIAGALPGISSTLTVGVTVTPDAGTYDYSYQFSITGAGAHDDNIFLASDDLSPLNVVLKVNGNPTLNWSWLGNDSPVNYLQFFNANGGALGNGDVLNVTFSSQLAPSNTKFAQGLNSVASDVTNNVTGLLAPTAVPEPSSVLFILSGIGLFPIVRRYAGKIRQ